MVLLITFAQITPLVTSTCTDRFNHLKDKDTISVTVAYFGHNKLIKERETNFTIVYKQNKQLRKHFRFA